MSFNEWQDSKYLFFLTTFLIPREINALPIMSAFEWGNLLGEEPLIVAEKLEKDGLLIRSNLATHLDYKYNSEELKEILEQKKLSTTGKKIELILRLMDTYSEDVWSVFSDVKILECSDVGTKMVHKYFLRHASNPELAFHELNIPSDKINERGKLIKWVLVAALGGIIGNRADEALLSLIQKTANAYPSVPTPTSLPVISPTPTSTPSPHPTQNQLSSSTPIIDEIISTPPYYRIDEWISKSEDDSNPNVIHIYISEHAIINKREIISKLQSYQSPLTIKIGVRLDSIEHGMKRNLQEGKVLFEVLSACLASGVCKGLDFDITTIYDEKLKRKAAYYAVLKALFNDMQDKS